MWKSRLGRWFSSLKLDLYTIFPQIISPKINVDVSSTSALSWMYAFLKRICVFRAHLIESTFTSCRVYRCVCAHMIYGNCDNAKVCLWWAFIRETARNIIKPLTFIYNSLHRMYNVFIYITLFNEAKMRLWFTAFS